jgi:hypothetical protein
MTGLLFALIITAAHMGLACGKRGLCIKWRIGSSPLSEPVVRILDMHFCLRGVGGMANRVGVVMEAEEAQAPRPPNHIGTCR